VATLAIAAAPQAQAQVTQIYQYDANGRLTGVTTTGASGTNTSAYVYDDANNRVSRTQTGTTAYATLLQMPANEWLRPDQALVSSDGQFSLALRSSGRLELWGPEGGTPDSQSGADTAFSLAPNGYARFSVAAVDAGQPGRTLALSDEGELVLADSRGEALWRSSEVVLEEVSQ
jgi:YD repeat-containing protein